MKRISGTHLRAKPSEFPPSPIVICTAPQGSDLPLKTRFYSIKTEESRLEISPKKAEQKHVENICSFIPSVHRHAHAQRALCPHQQRRAMVPKPTSSHPLHLDEPCCCCTTEHETKLATKVFSSCLPYQDQPKTRHGEAIS